MKNIIIIGVSVFLLIIIFLMFVNNQLQKERELKNHPTRYVYHKLDQGVSIALVSDDETCLKEIKKYHNDLDHGKESFIPGCLDHGLPVNSLVYVVSYNKDSTFAYIAHFYKNQRGVEKYFTGYILARMLHNKKN